MSTLSFKPFYVHKVRNRRRNDNNRMKHAPRGFTAFVTPTNHFVPTFFTATLISIKISFLFFTVTVIT